MRTTQGPKLVWLALVLSAAAGACSDSHGAEGDDADGDRASAAPHAQPDLGKPSPGPSPGSVHEPAPNPGAQAAPGAGSPASAAGTTGSTPGSGVGGAVGTAVVAEPGAMAGSDEPGGAVDPVKPVDDGSSACLDGITDYEAAGPFRFRATSSGVVKLWVPELPAGCRVPIVHFANGTGATCTTYAPVLEHMASHGFLTACYENTNTGAGTQCVTAIETALSEYPELTRMKAGSAGHSTGGGAALLCLNHARQKWGGALQIVAHGSQPDIAGLPGGWTEMLGHVAGPIAIFNGSEDVLASENSIRSVFEALPPEVEAYWHEGIGAPHIPVPVQWMKPSMVAWFRWQLLDDRAACEQFQALPDSDEWDLQAVNNPRGCD